MAENSSDWIFRAGADGQTRVSAVPALSLDPDGTIQFVNDAWTALTGYDRGVVGDRLQSLVPEDRRAGIEAILESIEPGEPIGTDLPIERGDCGRVPVRLSGEVEVGDDGTVTRIHCQCSPQSAPEHPGGTLAEQNALLGTLLDGLPVGLLAETVDRTVLAVNEELLSMFGLPEERADVIGRDCVRLAEEASDGFVDASAFVHGIQSRIDDGEPVLGERLERTDGRVFERSYLPIELPTGRGHLWTYEDVTAEQARKAELETYERLVEVAPVGVFRTTTDGRVLTTNQRLATILGYEDEAALLDNYENLARDLYVDPNRRDAFLERLQAETVVEDFEYEARIKGGGRRWLSMNARLLEERDEGSRVITGFTWDLTDRKRHERQLAVLGRILRHNLRNTLTVVEGQTEVLASETTDSNGAKEKILDRTGKLLELADKEREVAALLRGKTECVSQDLRVIAEETCADVRAEHPTATITVTGPESAPVSVCTGFERAIRELVENAVTHADETEPTVAVSIATDGDTTDIEVEDDGPGIPEVEQRILRGQADESPLVHSTGIGLFLVHQLVHTSNGSLFFGENEPQGSVVRIRLSSACE